MKEEKHPPPLSNRTIVPHPPSTRRPPNQCLSICLSVTAAAGLLLRRLGEGKTGGGLVVSEESGERVLPINRSNKNYLGIKLHPPIFTLL